MFIFIGQDDGPIIEEFIASCKQRYPTTWQTRIYFFFLDDASRWWAFFNHDKLMRLIDEDFEQVLLDRWSSNKSTNKESHKEILQKDNVSTNGLPSCKNSLLQVQGCL